MANIPGMTGSFKPFYIPPPWEKSLEKYMKNKRFREIRALLEGMGFSCSKSEKHHPDYFWQTMAPPPKPAKFTREDSDYYFLIPAMHNRNGEWYSSKKTERSRTTWDNGEVIINYRTEVLTWPDMFDKFSEDEVDIIIFNLDFLT